jgi:Fur family ferric uptake transcriptional regulator
LSREFYSSWLLLTLPIGTFDDEDDFGILDPNRTVRYPLLDMSRDTASHSSPLAELNLNAILELLRSHGLRITKSRQRILETLLAAREPLSLEEIQRRSSEEGVAPDFATVFRVMALLENLQVAQKVLLNRSCSYFELVDPQQHYDHIVCTECGRVTLMIDACPVERLEHAIGKKYGYTDLRHSLEFFGKCPECHSVSLS